MNISAFSAAIDEIAETKGLTREIVLEALRESIKKAYIKYLGGGDDAVVEVNFDPITNEITCRQLKTVVEEVQDDYLEVEYDEVNEGLKKPKWKVGDLYPIECPVEDMSKVFAKAVQNNFRSKLAEAERLALYDTYKDYIGEMITGTVEKSDDRSVFVNIGRTTVELTRRELIGDEFFKIGDPIKVYIQEVKQVTEEGKPSRGPQIEVTRSSDGFLKRLFEEEIHEIYDGTVLIKGIAREAGIRAKVAVASKNEDVDATGACIGQGGSRIQKIVAQLGNGKDKEKIDVISWSPNPALFIAEALRPAQVLGVAIEDEEEKTAIAVVRDEQLSLAIGKKGANARLANRLTGWKIDIIEENIALEDGIEFETVEEIMRKADEEKKLADRLISAKKEQEEVGAPNVSKEDITFSPAPAIETPAPAKEEPVVEETKPVEEPVVETPVQPTVEVKTTTKLDELEKDLEKSKSSAAKSDKPAKSKRPRKITEEEVEHAEPAKVAPAVNAMPIYSEEELADIEAEENALAEEDEYYNDIDEEYGDDDYYDEN